MKMAPALPYQLRVINNTRFVHNVQLFNPRYYVDGIEIESPISIITVNEMYYQIGFHPVRILPARCAIIRHNNDETLHGSRWIEDNFLERLDAWMVTKDAGGKSVHVPIEFDLNDKREQRGIADSKTEFRIGSLTYFCFYAYPGITYEFSFYPSKA